MRALVTLIGLGVLAAAACAVDPLRGDQLYGAPAADAADPAHDAGPPPDRAFIDTAPEPDAGADTGVDPAAPPDAGPDGPPALTCDMGNLNGSISGIFVDDCIGREIAGVQVGIGGKHDCAYTVKGSFHIGGLPVGCALTLTAKKPGYHELIQVVTIQPGGNPGMTLRLVREAGCGGTLPTEPACGCTPAGCG